MSEFDKEAEREKLREKFARDEEKRKNTRRMSELLLKGATMTNQHCNRCGDPIFRHDGEEFCPTCGGADAEQAADVPERDTEIETPEMELDSAQQAQQAQQTQDGAQTDAAGTETPADAAKQPAPTPERSAHTQGTPTATQPSQAASPTPQTGTARGELQRALSTAASNAAAAEDPATAKAWLEAAREAAEALSALDR